jgi:hypothetical protein
MSTKNHFVVVERTSLTWPSELRLPSKRFRLFVAADVSNATVQLISEFAQHAIKSGMVYFCAWGPNCERFHDIVDESMMDETGEPTFVAPTEPDTIMTTWHESDSLEEALDFFVDLAHPTDGFEPDSNCWLAISVSNPEWAETLKQRLEPMEN